MKKLNFSRQKGWSCDRLMLKSTHATWREQLFDIQDDDGRASTLKASFSATEVEFKSCPKNYPKIKMTYEE
jgi:hypothetical protein